MENGLIKIYSRPPDFTILTQARAWLAVFRYTFGLANDTVHEYILQVAGNIFKYMDQNGVIMEELLVYMILLYEGFVTEIEYNKRLDELFVNTPEDGDLLYLEWEKDISKAIIYVRTHIDYKNFDIEQFGRILMNKLNVVYKNCSDIKNFASQMYHLWESLPGNIQNIEPFWTLCYADDPLAWGDEKQTRNIYEHMLRYYEGSS